MNTLLQTRCFVEYNPTSYGYIYPCIDDVSVRVGFYWQAKSYKHLYSGHEPGVNPPPTCILVNVTQGTIWNILGMLRFRFLWHFCALGVLLVLDMIQRKFNGFCRGAFVS